MSRSHRVVVDRRMHNECPKNGIFAKFITGRLGSGNLLKRRLRRRFAGFLVATTQLGVLARLPEALCHNEKLFAVTLVSGLNLLEVRSDISSCGG